MTPTIMGLDLSLSATGLAVRKPDGRVHIRTIVTYPDTLRERRHHIIAEDILSFVDPNNTIVVTERRIKPQEERTITAMELARVDAVVLYWLWRMGCIRVDVSPQTVKVYATGSGRASKPAMVAAALGRLGHVTYVADDNQADALWFMAMGCAQYGEPLVALPAKNTRAMDSVTWPTWRENTS
jgi:Holliday junction resolvasome RuvABC endonuclease subunit